MRKTEAKSLHTIVSKLYEHGTGLFCLDCSFDCFLFVVDCILLFLADQCYSNFLR